MATKIDLSERVRDRMVALLNDRLAELIDLWTHAKEAHWNVRGPGFKAVHELFDEVAAAVAEAVDDVAERAVQLGGRAEGTLRQAAKASELPRYPGGLVSQSDHVAALAKSMGWAGKRLRAAIDQADEAGDKATADLFTEHTRAFDKLLWMVEAHGG